MIINTRADLDALRGTDGYQDALRNIAGAMTTWVADEADGWTPLVNTSVLTQLGLTELEFTSLCAEAGVPIVSVPPDPRPADPPTPVPTFATKLGLKRALDEVGLWATVRAAIAADPSVQEEWDLAIQINRTDPLVARLVAALGLTEEQIDAMLVRAHELTQ